MSIFSFKSLFLLTQFQNNKLRVIITYTALAMYSDTLAKAYTCINLFNLHEKSYNIVILLFLSSK